MGATVYEVRVEGTVTDDVLDAVAQQVDGLHVAVEPVVTVLQGPMADQSALRGLLARLESLGAVVLEVRRVPPVDQGAG
jgi:hypothetical protein